MESELQGRLRNTYLPPSKAMVPLYEAVVNSIQAIEEQSAHFGQPVASFEVNVRIRRSQTLFSSTDSPEASPIDGFEVEDEGSGFNDDNWNSFKKLDTLYKAERGCRGIGRLMWLKAFKEVEIESIYISSEGTLLQRNFLFHPIRGVEQCGEPKEVSRPRTTVVKLKGFEERYADHSLKTLKSISAGILEHCLWYFIRAEGVPVIRVVDGIDSVLLDDLFEEHMHSSAKGEPIKIGEYSFEITHVKFRANLNKPNTLNYCAAGRLVTNENLKGKILGLSATMADELGDFTYAAYLTGPYLDERVLAQRIGFYIDDDNSGLFEGLEITFTDIRNAVVPRIKSFLEESLSRNVAASKERIESFVSRTAPRYRPILRHIDADELIVDPSINNRDLDLALHRQLYKVEEKLLSEGHQIMVPLKDETEQAYQKRLQRYLEIVSDLKQSDLANYITHRRTIIDLLESAIQSNATGAFAYENVIHELIVPMQITSDDYKFRRENLWLIDERLAFHDFLASDKPISTIEFTDEGSGKEPDVAALRVFDTPILVSDKDTPAASLTIIEIKRPMKKNYKAGANEESDPILQALDYLSRLRHGAAARGGRPIPNAERIPGFIHILADLTENLKRCCDLHNLTKTADGMGYFGYHPNARYNAYIQVLSFDGIVMGAKERNRAFFDKLGLPAR